MINEDMRVKYIEFAKKNAVLERKLKLYQENYHDIDIGSLHEKNQKLVSL
jgi:hypothetical protein